MSYGNRLRQSASQLHGWQNLPFFSSPGFCSLCDKLDRETGQIAPAADQAFAALRMVAPQACRVVILGQDPYPTPGNANGLAFSVGPGMPLPASLKNIFCELRDDTGIVRTNGDLSGWASQGVLLLNTVLTVLTGCPNSHANFGWKPLITEVLRCVAAKDGIVWMLWGQSAKMRYDCLGPKSGQNQCVITTSHPSPLSAYRTFFGSKPFSRANAHLARHNTATIDWSA